MFPFYLPNPFVHAMATWTFVPWRIRGSVLLRVGINPVRMAFEGFQRSKRCCNFLDGLDAWRL
jgi:hypothetical protein